MRTQLGDCCYRSPSRPTRKPRRPIELPEGGAMSARRPEAVDYRGRVSPEAGGALVPTASGNVGGRHLPVVLPRRVSLMQEPVLVLNATYEPINVTAVRRAMVLMLKGVAQAEEMHSAEVH